MVKVKPVFLVIIGLLLLVFAVNMLIPEPGWETQKEHIEFAELRGNYRTAWEVYKSAVYNDPTDMDLHYGFIQSHYRLEETDPDWPELDEYIRKYYRTLSTNDFPEKRDAGLYVRGLMASFEGECSSALEFFSKVENRELKYLNNSIGNCLLEKDQLDEAEKHFFKEIQLEGNTEGAYSNLAEIHRLRDETDELLELWENESSRSAVSPSEVRMIYIGEGRVLGYVLALLSGVFRNLNLFGFIGALLILIVWSVYLRKIDLYDKDSVLPSVYAALLGMLFSFGVFIINDVIGNVFWLDTESEVINMFVYAIFGIGLIEELVKIIPLFLLLKYTSHIREPYDYLLYASLSALGFAFIENLIYFESFRLEIIHGRGLIAVVLHMFCSSLAAYGLILNRYRGAERPILNILKYFGLAVLVHGFWDFWVMTPTLSKFGIVSLLMFISMISVWNSLKNNALNQSEFFDKRKQHDREKLTGYLMIALGSILGFEYFANSIQNGPNHANGALLGSLTSGSYLMFFLSTRLGRFELEKDTWRPIRYWHSKKSKIPHEAIVGENVSLFPFSQHREAAKYLPNSGKIIERKTVTGEKDWYLIEMEKDAENTKFLPDRVLVRTKEKSDSLLFDKPVLVYFYLIPNSLNLDALTLKRRELFFAYWAKVTLVSPELPQEEKS